MKVSRRNLPFRMLEHTADLRVRIYGRNLPDLFRNALRALADILTDSKKIRTKSCRKIRISADEPVLLLVHLLREALFLFDTRRFLPRRLQFERRPNLLKDKVLEAELWGEMFHPKRHSLKTEVKAVTYHGLKVVKQKGRWTAEVVFDV